MSTTSYCVSRTRVHQTALRRRHLGDPSSIVYVCVVRSSKHDETSMPNKDDISVS